MQLLQPSAVNVGVACMSCVPQAVCAWGVEADPEIVEYTKFGMYASIVFEAYHFLMSTAHMFIEKPAHLSLKCSQTK